jgi:hypothetical protein
MSSNPWLVALFDKITGIILQSFAKSAPSTQISLSVLHFLLVAAFFCLLYQIARRQKTSGNEDGYSNPGGYPVIARVLLFQQSTAVHQDLYIL